MLLGWQACYAVLTGVVARLVRPDDVVVLSCCWTDAFFAPTAFTGQQLAGVSAPSHTSGVTMKIFDWKRRQEPDGVGERLRTCNIPEYQRLQKTQHTASTPN